MTRKLLFLIASTFALGLAGCGYGPGDLCDDACDCQGCSDHDYEECVDNGEDLERDVEREGCEDEYDELLSCMSDADNACDSLEDECEDDRDELEECIADYCDDNSSDECEELAEVDID